MILVLILLTVIGSSMFAGLETGMVSLNKVRLRARARRGDASAETLLELLQHPDRVLSTFLVGNTLCNIGGGALASFWAVDMLKSETTGSVLATAVMSAIFLVVSEVAPKSFFRLRAEEAVPRLLWFVRGSIVVFSPVVGLTTRLLRLVTGPSGRSPFVTREELRQLVREGGALGPKERRMLENVFDFGHTVAREVMIPLPEVASLPESATTDNLLDFVRQHRFTRIPVYRDRVDVIVGLVNVFDVLYARPREPQLGSYVRPIHIVPETSRIRRVLEDLQGRRETMALVVNEFGGCIGIVTVPDIVEEIMGELADEHREARVPVLKVADGFLVDGSLDIDDLNEELRAAVAKDRYDTVGGLLLHRLGRIPEVGERVEAFALEFEVLSVHKYGIKRIKIRRQTARKGG